MIISASRRCDLPAFGMDALMAWLRAGFREVPNPFDARRSRRVSLASEDVDCLVLWTRDPRPLLPRIREIEGMGIRFYVHVTITGLPEALEPGAPRAADAARAFAALSDAIGAERALWRFDPVFVARGLDADGRRGDFETLASALEGRTRRVTLSLLDEYARTKARLAKAGYPDPVFGTPRPRRAAPEPRQDIPEPPPASRLPPEPYPALLAELAAIARARGIEPVSCAEPFDLSGLGIARGACVDAALIEKLFGIEVSPAGDPGQRKACACAPSVDLGEYGACRGGCAYCYARR